MYDNGGTWSSGVTSTGKGACRNSDCSCANLSYCYMTGLSLGSTSIEIHRGTRDVHYSGGSGESGTSGDSSDILEPNEATYSITVNY